MQPLWNPAPWRATRGRLPHCATVIVAPLYSAELALFKSLDTRYEVARQVSLQGDIGRAQSHSLVLTDTLNFTVPGQIALCNKCLTTAGLGHSSRTQ